jgi:hypothetical protein
VIIPIKRTLVPNPGIVIASSQGMANAKSQSEVNANLPNTENLCASLAHKETGLSLGLENIEALRDTGKGKAGSKLLVSPIQRRTPVR